VDINLKPGNYQIAFDSGAVNFNGGWVTQVTKRDTGVIYFDNGTFGSSAAAEAAASGQTATFNIAVQDDYNFYFQDSFYGDNSGSILCTITSI